MICGQGSDATPEQTERWLELRMTRQGILEEGSSRLAAILDESVLRRQVGSPETMANQLRYLVERSDPVEIRVLPFRAGSLASTRGSFGIFRMPDPFPEVAYAETLAGAIYIESPDSERFAQAYDGHRNLSLEPDDSAELISAIAEEWQ